MELRDDPEAEAEELALIYRAKGLDPAEAERAAAAIMKDRSVALDTMAREELGLDPDALGSPWSAAFSSLFAFALGAIVVVLPYLFGSGRAALIVAIVLAGLALFGVGAAIATGPVVRGDRGDLERRRLAAPASRSIRLAASAGCRGPRRLICSQRCEGVVGRRRKFVLRGEAVARCDDDRANVVGERALVDYGKPAGDESAAVEVHDDGRGSVFRPVLAARRRGSAHSVRSAMGLRRELQMAARVHP
jgi:VIT family